MFGLFASLFGAIPSTQRGGQMVPDTTTLATGNTNTQLVHIEYVIQIHQVNTGNTNTQLVHIQYEIQIDQVNTGNTTTQLLHM